MNYNKNNIKASWLHISDLHVFPEADTTLMLTNGDIEYFSKKGYNLPTRCPDCRKKRY